MLTLYWKKKWNLDIFAIKVSEFDLIMGRLKQNYTHTRIHIYIQIFLNLISKLLFENQYMQLKMKLCILDNFGGASQLEQRKYNQKAI